MLKSVLECLFSSEWLTIFCILVYYDDNNIPPLKKTIQTVSILEAIFLTKKYQPELFKEENY